MALRLMPDVAFGLSPSYVPKFTSRIRMPVSLSPSWTASPLAGRRMGSSAAATVPGVVSPRLQVSATVAAPHTESFLKVTTEEELLGAINHEIEMKRLPSRAKTLMEEFYQSYKEATLSSGVPDAEEVAVRVMAMVFDRIMVQFEEPFTFSSHHKRITEPYDYYAFGQKYVQPLIDYKNSFIGNQKILDDIDEQLRQGDNVVLLANHQTEADPAVMALLLEHSHPRLATDLTYVAGDRVVLDPFCKPFSMGRNLLCVYSKKHINDIPELAAEKSASNRRTLKEMAMLFNKGGNLIWVAPSGGRDRPDPVTDEFTPAAFDPSAVELMRRLVDDASPPGHLYPLALICYDIMPPPRKVEKKLGEKRVIGFHGVGLSVAPELDFESITEGISDRRQARDAYSDAVFATVKEHYEVLEAAIHGERGFSAAKEGVALSQPWLESQ